MSTPRRVERCYREFGRLVRRERIIQGMLQGELARKVRMSRTSIVNIELGRQRVLLGDVDRFAKALKTRPIHLLWDVW